MKKKNNNPYSSLILNVETISTLESSLDSRKFNDLSVNQSCKTTSVVCTDISG